MPTPTESMGFIPDDKTHQGMTDKEIMDKSASDRPADRLFYLAGWNARQPEVDELKKENQLLKDALRTGQINNLIKGIT